MLLPQIRPRRCSANAQPRALPASCLARFPMHFPCGEATRPGLRKHAERACGTVACNQFSSTGRLSMRGLAKQCLTQCCCSNGVFKAGPAGVQAIDFGQGRRTFCQIFLDLVHGLRPDVRSQVHTGRQQGEKQFLPVQLLVFSCRCLAWGSGKCLPWSLLLGSAGRAVARIT